MPGRTRRGFKRTAEDSYGSHKAYLCVAFLRFCQFVLAGVAGFLYGLEVLRAQNANQPIDLKWIFAVFVGIDSAIMSAIMALPFIEWCQYKLFIGDSIFCGLWLLLFILMGKLMFLSHGSLGADVVLMKHAVWLDGVNAVLWLVTLIWGVVKFFKTPKTPKLPAGRAYGGGGGYRGEEAYGEE